MAEEFVGHRECEMQHEALSDRLNKMESRSDENFGRVFEKLDSLSVFKGRVEISDQKIEVLGKKFDKHVDGHTGFYISNFGDIDGGVDAGVGDIDYSEKIGGVMALFNLAYQKTGSKEGGYVDNAKDPGGETNMGITKYVAIKNGYTGDMKLLPKEKAQEIYKKEYWDALGLDSVTDQDVAEELFDTGVNCGIGTIAGFIQKSLNAMNRQGQRWQDLKEDGSIGLASISALNQCLGQGFKSVLLKALNCLQGAYYIDISRRNPDLEEFIIGWFRNRVDIGG